MRVTLPRIEPETVRQYGYYLAHYAAFTQERGLDNTRPSSARDFMAAVQPYCTYQQFQDRYYALRRFFLERGVSLKERPEYWDSHLRLREGLLQTARRGHAEYITDAELRQLAYGIPKSRVGAHDKAAILLMYNTGASRYEMLRVRPEHIQWIPTQGMEIELQARYGRRLARVPLHPDLRLCCVTAVRFWTSKVVGAVVFGTLRREEPRSDIHAQFLGDVMERNLKPCGIARELPISALKYGYVVAAIQRGADDDTIMRAMGYRAVESVQRWRRRVAAERTRSIFDFTEESVPTPWGDA